MDFINLFKKGYSYRVVLHESTLYIKVTSEVETEAFQAIVVEYNKETNLINIGQRTISSLFYNIIDKNVTEISTLDFRYQVDLASYKLKNM